MQLGHLLVDGVSLKEVKEIEKAFREADSLEKFKSFLETKSLNPQQKEDLIKRFRIEKGAS